MESGEENSRTLIHAKEGVFDTEEGENEEEEGLKEEEMEEDGKLSAQIFPEANGIPGEHRKKTILTHSTVQEECNQWVSKPVKMNSTAASDPANSTGLDRHNTVHLDTAMRVDTNTLSQASRSTDTNSPTDSTEIHSNTPTDPLHDSTTSGTPNRSLQAPTDLGSNLLTRQELIDLFLSISPVKGRLFVCCNSIQGLPTTMTH